MRVLIAFARPVDYTALFILHAKRFNMHEQIADCSAICIKCNQRIHTPLRGAPATRDATPQEFA